MEEELRKIANEEMKKIIMTDIDSSIIFTYIQTLEKQNKEMKQILKERYGYLYE